MFYNPSPPRIFLSLDLLSEYRIQHGAIGSLFDTSSYSTWIFCRGVSGFAIDCPCGVWCRGLTQLPPACWSAFWKSIFKQQFGCRCDIMDSIWVRSRSCGCLVTWFCYQFIAKPGNTTAAVSRPDPYLNIFFLYFDICNYICLDISYHFLSLSLLLKYSLFFKYSCTNIFHRRSLYTFYLRYFVLKSYLVIIKLTCDYQTYFVVMFYWGQRLNVQFQLGSRHRRPPCERQPPAVLKIWLYCKLRTILFTY